MRHGKAYVFKADNGWWRVNMWVGKQQVYSGIFHTWKVAHSYALRRMRLTK